MKRALKQTFKPKIMFIVSSMRQLFKKNKNERMKRFTKLYLLVLFAVALAIPHQLHAQKDLQISKVFDMYGKKKGVVMVEISGEMLESYDFTLFKSIIIKNDPAAAEFARKCIAKDQEGAKKIKQVLNSGELTSIVLQLARKGKDNRLILYNESPGGETQITLVYIESKIDVESIMNMILKKK